jgi:hypothetical protein
MNVIHIFLQLDRQDLVSTYIYAFGDLLFDWPKSRQKGPGEFKLANGWWK